jgi:hypothetical protein
MYYRVSHSKEWKVILLWWGHRFWFFLIIRVLQVHEIDSFMPNSSIFYFFDVAIGWYVKVEKKFFGKKTLNVPNVKLLSNFFFNIFGFFMPFWWEWQLALYMLSDFPGIKNLSGLNDLNSLSGLNDLYSLISSKNLYFKVKMYFFDGLILFII